MTHEASEGLQVLADVYKDLPDLESSRAVYLNALNFRSALDLAPGWDPRLDNLRGTYARAVSGALHSVMTDGAPDDIEELVVGHIISEETLRWSSYAGPIAGTKKEPALIEALSNMPLIITDVAKKTERLRENWRTFLNEGYTGLDTNLIPGVAAEFCRDQIILDAGREELLLRALETEPQPKVA